MAAGSLSGLKVVEVSSLVAGPALGSLMVSLGAEVLKIEQPVVGDPSRTVSPWGFLNYNYGKKSVSLNLKTKKGQEILHCLVAKSDILIENLGPGVSERLSFSYDILRKINPRIIYCSIKGFARDSPYSNKPAFDAVAQAMSGTMALTGEPGGEPLRIGNPSIDLGAASYGGIGILAAILQREKSGEGKFIEISLLDMAVYWNGYWLTYYGITGELPERLGSGHLGYCPHRVFKTRDGKFVFIAALNDSQWVDLATLLNIQLGKEFDKMEFRIKNRRLVEEEVSRVVGNLDLDQILQKIERTVPCAGVNSIAEVYENEDLKNRGVLVSMDYKNRRTEIARPPILSTIEINRMNPAGNTSQSVLEVGADTFEVLAQIGYSKEDLENLHSNGVI